MDWIADNDLIEYVVEVDLEDKVSRIILDCNRDLDTVGTCTLVDFLRGYGTFRHRRGKNWESARQHYGRLRQLTRDQVHDFVESLTRLGLIDRIPYGRYHQCTITQKGLSALKSNAPIPAQIPWPLPSKRWPI